MHRSLLAACAAIALSAPALAADIYAPLPEPDYVAEKPIGAWAGYVEAYAGYMFQDFGPDGDDDEEVQLGGAARFAHAFAPGFSGQVDLWTESSGVIDSGES